MAGVYIAYPFCNQKCTFCNFASGVFSHAERLRYQRTLLEEVRTHDWQWQPETIYFGGGTPSLMPLEFLAELLDVISRDRVTEVTLECAPGTISRETVECWRRCGVNRISLGVQSFVTAELRQTGRRHTAEIVSDEVRVLREHGLKNINIDLIAGLPGQTSQSWEHSLDWIERIDPPHVSIYIFEVDEDSRLGQEVLIGGTRYGACNVPNEDLTAELYERAVERLAAIGIERYEISNFASAGWESRHNLKYWLLEPYAGFGLDAHSFDGKYRWSNPDNLEEYRTRNERERVTTNVSEERFFVGLRLARGIEPTQDEWSRFAQPIEKHIRSGLLEQQGGTLRLSDRGVLLSNEVFQEFVNA